MDCSKILCEVVIFLFAERRGEETKSASGEPDAHFDGLTGKDKLSANHLLLNGHHGSGSNRLSGNLLLLLLLAGNESGGRKSEDSNLLHNYLTSFDVV